MVHSDRTVVVLLHKHFSSRHSTSFNSISIVTKWTYATTESNIMVYVKNSFTFKKSRKNKTCCILCICYASCILDVLCVFDLHVFMPLYIYIYIHITISASYWVVFDPSNELLIVNKDENYRHDTPHISLMS
jgi:hypothetical protein